MNELELRLIDEKEQLRQTIEAKKEWEKELKKLQEKEERIKQTISRLNYSIELDSKIIEKVEKEIKGE